LYAIAMVVPVAYIYYLHHRCVEARNSRVRSTYPWHTYILYPTTIKISETYKIRVHHDYVISMSIEIACDIQKLCTP
jgi:hypothetical protein